MLLWYAMFGSFRLRHDLLLLTMFGELDQLNVSIEILVELCGLIISPVKLNTISTIFAHAV